MSWLEELKLILRESDIPFFTDDELMYYYEKNNHNLNNTAYQCLILKSEDTKLSMSGLTLADSSSYFKRLAAQYRPKHSGTLKGN